MKINHAQASGFSLKELLIGVGIMAALMVATFPAMQAMREKSQGVSCLSNLRQIGVLTQRYLGDNGGRIFPDARLLPGGMAENPNDEWGRWIGAMNEMLDLPTTMASNPELRGPELKILICPADKTRGGWNIYGAQNGIPGSLTRRDGIKAHSYLPNRLMLGQSVTSIQEPSKAILFVEADWEKIGARSIYPHNTVWMNLISGASHQDYAHTLFVDGHAEPLKASDLKIGGAHQNYWYRDRENPDSSYR